MKTLVVEDEPTSRLMLQSVLSLYGECHSAVNGDGALEAFRMAVETPQGVVQAFNALCDE
jgi:two-component system chemotaxis response regulator CheY